VQEPHLGHYRHFQYKTEQAQIDARHYDYFFLEKKMANVDSKENSVVAVYPQHSDAENAINLLKKSDFNIKKLAIVGQGYHTEDQVVGYYTTGDRMKHWGKTGAFWGGLWGLLVGSAFFIIPGVGPVMVAGSAVAWIVGALESAVVVGGLSALGAGLYSIGIPKDSALKYESSIKAGKFLLIAHGTAEEAEAARRILANTGPEELNVHQSDQPAVAA
jgi:hypothetical protein